MATKTGSQPLHMKVTDQKRAAILDAAIKVFGAQGFEPSSMDQIAKVADVSKRTVYNHFENKEALFAEILNQLWDRSPFKLDIEYQPSKPLQDQLTDLLWQTIEMLSEPMFLKLARVAIAETIHSPERAQCMLDRLAVREESISAWVRAASNDKKLNVVDVAFAANQLHALIKGFAFWPQITLNSPPLNQEEQKRVVESAVDIFINTYALK